MYQNCVSIATDRGDIYYLDGWAFQHRPPFVSAVENHRNAAPWRLINYLYELAPSHRQCQAGYDDSAAEPTLSIFQRYRECYKHVTKQAVLMKSSLSFVLVCVRRVVHKLHPPSSVFHHIVETVRNKKRSPSNKAKAQFLSCETIFLFSLLMGGSSVSPTWVAYFVCFVTLLIRT